MRRGERRRRRKTTASAKTKLGQAGERVGGRVMMRASEQAAEAMRMVAVHGVVVLVMVVKR